MSNFMGVGIFWIGLNRADLSCWQSSLTLRAPRVLVPTPSTKGGGVEKDPPPVSQEREMLQT